MSERTHPTWQPHMSIEDERAQVWRAIEANGTRIDNLETVMEQTVTRAVKEAMPTALLNAEEYRWVQLAIRREAQSIAFRQSVIDKTLTGLVWALIVGMGIMVKEYMTAHGWRS